MAMKMKSPDDIEDLKEETDVLFKKLESLFDGEKNSVVTACCFRLLIRSMTIENVSLELAKELFDSMFMSYKNLKDTLDGSPN